MHKKFRQLLTTLKEQSYVSYAKVATAGGFCDVNLIIIKATTSDDLPLPERYVRQLLTIFSISTSSFHAYAISFARRFRKTNSWRVALKCLLLLHRLLKSLPENSPFRTELLWARSNGLFSLYPCRFRDDSSSAPQKYTMFIGSYARLLDELLTCGFLDWKASETDWESGEITEKCYLTERMKEVSVVLDVLPQFQNLIDRVINCRPLGRATSNFLVRSAMKHIIRESFFCYKTFRGNVVLVLDNLFQIPYRSCITAFRIYKKTALQASQLAEFYDWCKVNGFCGSYEYPYVDRIPQIHIQALENFLDEMWQLTDSKSSTESTSSLTENEEDKNEEIREFVFNTSWVKFDENGFSNLCNGDDKDDKELEPLICLDDSWEELLEASVNSPYPNTKYMLMDIDGSKQNHNEDKSNMQLLCTNTTNNPFQINT